MHMAATCLHYGQEAFEGLKAFRGKDGKVRIFRLEENAARLPIHLPWHLDAGTFYGAFQRSYSEGGEAERAFHSALLNRVLLCISVRCWWVPVHK